MATTFKLASIIKTEAQVKFRGRSVPKIEETYIYIIIDQLGWNSLERAIDGHSDGGLHATPLVKVCWDADRLDLGRVDIMPDPVYLCTDTAKHPAVIQGAYKRSRKWVKSRS